MRIIGVCLSRTRSVIRGNSRQYILIAGLYRLPSVVVSLSTFVSRLSPITYCQFIVSSDHQFFKSSLFFAFLQLTPLLPCLRWRPVDGCCLLAPHLSGVAVWRRNLAAAACDACQQSSIVFRCWHGAARDDLVSSVTRLLFRLIVHFVEVSCCRCVLSSYYW